MTTVVLTVRQPFAAAIFWADPLKDVENRTWLPPQSPPFNLFIHTGTRDATGWEASPMARVLAAIPAEYRSQRSVILGRVTVTGIVRDSSSPWARPAAYHWLLADPRPVPLALPLRGRMKVWPLEQAIRALFEEDEDRD
jgi:hypothetical protein